jgi:hypothetical protein
MGVATHAGSLPIHAMLCKWPRKMPPVISCITRSACSPGRPKV